MGRRRGGGDFFGGGGWDGGINALVGPSLGFIFGQGGMIPPSDWDRGCDFQKGIFGATNCNPGLTFAGGAGGGTEGGTGPVVSQNAANNATTATNCSVTVECDKSWTPHCGLTVGQNGKYTDYNGEPSTAKLGPLVNPFSNVTLMVQVNGPTAPPGGPGTGNIIFQSPVSCSVTNCIQKSADYTNAAGLPYSAPGIRGENSNWWASTTTRVCGLSVNYPWNAIGTVP